mgnify:CR=1 FL=1
MQNINILQIIINYLVPLIFGTIIGFISTKAKANNKKDKAIEEGVQALLRNELVRRYREYEAKGEISILDKENMEAMFVQYQNLGGNGTVKHLMDDMLDLKTKIIK